MKRELSWATGGVLLGSLALYLHTLTGVHTFDALSYITSVERKPWVGVLFPHHLAYGPVSEAAVALGQLLGVIGAALPMQVLSALAGAGALALLLMTTFQLTQRLDLALLAALLPGSAYAYWYFAGETDVYALSTFWMALSLFFLVRLYIQPARSLALGLGVAHSVALLFHQANIWFVAAVAVVFVQQWLAGSQLRPKVMRFGELLRMWWPYPVTGILLVGGAYLGAAFVIGFTSVDAFVAWFSGYAATGWWGSSLATNRWLDLAQGLSDTLAQPNGGWFGLALLGILLLHVRGLWQTSAATSGRSALVVALLVWLVLHSVFFFWWEPDNVKFWIVALLPFALLLALALQSTRRWGLGVIASLGIVLTMGVSNYAALLQRTDPRTDLQRDIAAAVAGYLVPADLALVPDGMLELYLPYYHNHDNYLSLNQALFDNQSRWDATCSALQQRIDTTLHAGAEVLIADEVLSPPPELLERFGLQTEQVAGCFAAYRPALEPLTLPAQVPTLWRLPTSTEMVPQGWVFQSFQVGWQATQVSASVVDVNGWQFVPQTDPALLSPLLNIEATEYQAIEIRLRNLTQQRDAQLFFAGPDQQIREEASLRWELRPTTASETYRLDLASMPTWRGIITRLRLDPVGVGDGGIIVVESIRLIGMND